MRNRRRALMAQEEAASDILYLLENETVTRGTSINTGLKPLASDVTVTILFDFTNTEAPAGGDSSTMRYIDVYDDALGALGLRFGKKQGTISKYYAGWMGTMDGDTALGSASMARMRVAVLHEANSPTVTIYVKRATGTKVTWTKTAESFTPAPGNNLYFGQSGNNSLPAGTITKAAVYNRILASSELDSFFA